MKTRYSKKKETILNLFNKEHLLTANQIIEQVSKTIDRATVYRNIQKLLEEGVIKEVHLENSQATYELSKNSHQHFICTNCSKVFTFAVSEQIIAKAIHNPQLQIENIELRVSGKCEDCR